jgi:hypothetical protein
VDDPARLPAHEHRPDRAAAGSSSAASARWIARASCCRPRAVPFLINRTEPLAVVEAEHRQHAIVELAIRDLKDQALAHFPSGRFFPNAAWTVIAALAHNLLRWTSVLGLPHRTLRAARAMRRRLLTVPGRPTRTARRWTLHLPAGWPWQTALIEALTRVRALPGAGWAHP